MIDDLAERYPKVFIDTEVGSKKKPHKYLYHYSRGLFYMQRSAGLAMDTQCYSTERQGHTNPSIWEGSARTKSLTAWSGDDLTPTYHLPGKPPVAQDGEQERR
jgi:hypothetical protein